VDVVKTGFGRVLGAVGALALLVTARHANAEIAVVKQQDGMQIVRAKTLKAMSFDPVASAPLFPLRGPAPEATAAAAQTIPLRPTVRPLASQAVISPWDTFVEEASRRFALPAEWLRGVMRIESGGHAMLDGRPITSRAGAMGLMQVMPATFADMARRYGLGADPYDPRANILAGAAFLREMYDRFGPAHFVAAYNAGPGRVDEHLRRGRPLPRETQRYVQILAPMVHGPAAGVGAPVATRARAAVSSVVSARSVSSHSRPSSAPPTRPLFVLTGEPSTPARHADGGGTDALFVRLTREIPSPDERTRSVPED
jgi:soluble lytic murein transglycosylase-like protein